VGELVVFVAVVAAVAVIGLGAGMLVARWLDRRVGVDDPPEDTAEEPGGHQRTDA
jgi:hypothetical protein